MVRKIIKIDEERCDGCGACVRACHEGAIDIIDGKAKLTRENYCDGLGDCLPNCHAGAITFEEREAPAYDEAAVMAAKQAKHEHHHHGHHHHDGAACPGSQMRIMEPESAPCEHHAVTSQLKQWPCQIRLVPISAPYFKGAKLLIAADCTAYAYANMHDEFMRGRVTLVGCPKLDGVDYTQKLSEIIRLNDIKSVTVIRMEVPCCGGLEEAAKTALKNSGKFIPWRVVTVSIDGKIIDSD